MLLDSIRRVEVQKGRPVYLPEIYKDLVERQNNDEDEVVFRVLIVELLKLFKEDRVLCDTEINMYSLNPAL